MASVGSVYCICGQINDTSSFMIQCDICREWFHGRCINVKEYDSIDIEKYHCPRCQKIFGEPVRKERMNNHRHDYSDPDADGKKVQTGTPAFIQELKSRCFSSADEVVVRLRAQLLTLPYLLQSGFERPLLVENKSGLGMLLPPEEEKLSVLDIMKYLGEDFSFLVIDVTRQNNIRMTMREWADYFLDPNRTKVYNVISLEFSNTRLSEVVKPPDIVNKLCWVANYWPVNASNYTDQPRPNVSKYCLMGTKDSFTDFHIDFGGTSVWYHVLRGEKVFYLIEPTPANVALYERWQSSATMSETFFGDQVASCRKLVLGAGHTLFIPTGWIHAVLTTQDTLVFGGNFLSSLNIPLQLQVYEMEKRTKTPDQFKFPSFEAVTWFAAPCILEQLKESMVSDRRTMAKLAAGVKSMIQSFKIWIQEKEKHRHEEPPRNLNVHKLIKDMAKELRVAEKHLNKQENPEPLKLPRRSAQKKDKYILPDSSFKLTPPHKPKLLPSDTTTPLKLRIPQSRIISSSKEKSIYDFEDSDDDALVVDESRPTENQPDNRQQQPALKLRLSFNGKPLAADIKTEDLPPNKNGTIDDLLMASSMASIDVPSQEEEVDLSGGRTSPSTREAIQGMLCMSKSAFLFNKDPPAAVGGGDSTVTSSTEPLHNYSLLSQPRRFQPDDEFEESLKKCHQDDDFIYLGLEENSDEEMYVFKPRGGKTNKDDNWNPKAKLTPNLPKPVRPVREGVKKEAIETGLAAAAAKLAHLPSPKRQYIRKKPPPPPTLKEEPLEEMPSTSSGSNKRPPVTHIANMAKKPKKGFATTKQRLGKILKIHKMLY